MGRRGLPPAMAGMWRCHISLGSKTGNLLCPSTIDARYNGLGEAPPR